MVHMFQPSSSSKQEVSNEVTISEVAPWYPPEGRFWILSSLKAPKMNSPGPSALPVIHRKLDFAFSSQELS